MSLKISKLIINYFIVQEMFLLYLQWALITLITTALFGLFMRRFIEKPSYQCLINSKIHKILMNKK